MKNVVDASDEPRCSICNGVLETPFEKERGAHTDCIRKQTGDRRMEK